MYDLREVPGPDVDGRSHADLLVALARFLQPAIYIELGVEKGYTFKLVHEEQIKAGRNAVGCEVTKGLYEEVEGAHYGLSSVDFLWRVPDASVGLAFIDANHMRDMVYADLVAVAPKMAINGVVAIHDTYPPDRNCLHGNWCGDGWEIIPKLRQDQWFMSQFEMMTLPSQFGLTLMRKHRGRHLAWHPGSVM